MSLRFGIFHDRNPEGPKHKPHTSSYSTFTSHRERRPATTDGFAFSCHFVDTIPLFAICCHLLPSWAEGQRTLSPSVTQCWRSSSALPWTLLAKCTGLWSHTTLSWCLAYWRLQRLLKHSAWICCWYACQFSFKPLATTGFRWFPWRLSALFCPFQFDDLFCQRLDDPLDLFMLFPTRHATARWSTRTH